MVWNIVDKNIKVAANLPSFVNNIIKGTSKASNNANIKTFKISIKINIFFLSNSPLFVLDYKNNFLR